MNLIANLKAKFARREQPESMRRGQLGEAEAKKLLKEQGLKFLTANFKTDRGEIDLVFRDNDCLVFVEVKARQGSSWTRPARAVDARKRRALSRCAMEYLRLLPSPQVKIRFDVVEVLLEDRRVLEVRHLPNTFALAPPYRYG